MNVDSTERISLLKRAISLEYTKRKPCYIAIECMQVEIEILQKTI